MMTKSVQHPTTAGHGATVMIKHLVGPGTGFVTYCCFHHHANIMPQHLGFEDASFKTLTVSDGYHLAHTMTEHCEHCNQIVFLWDCSLNIIYFINCKYSTL